MVTRISQETADEISKVHPLKYNALAKIGMLGEMPEPDGDGTIVVATGGTSDMPIAEEAALTAEALGNKVVRLYDVGVPSFAGEIEGELSTPTGTALIRHFAQDYSQQPPMVVDRRGYGVGKKDFGRLSAVRASIGEAI